MKKLNEFINESLNVTVFEGLLDILSSGMKPEKFCKTIAESINKDIQVKYKNYEGKEHVNNNPVRVSLMFEDLIITEFGQKSWKEQAKSIATSYDGKFDEAKYKSHMEYLKSVWKDIKTYGGDFVEESDRIVGAIQVNIDYYDKDGNWKIYTYSRYLMFGEESKKEFFDNLQKGKIDKSFIRSIYWNLFVAIFNPNDEWANENLKSFKKYCDPQIKERIKKLVGSGAEEKLKEWENKKTEK